MKKRISLICLASLGFILAVVDYARSFYQYGEMGDYFGFGASTDSLIIMLSSLCVLVLTILNLVGYLKQKNYTKEIEYTTLALVGFNACYSLFTMIKAIAKAVNKLWDGGTFSLAYPDIELYLYWFLLSGALLVYLIFAYLEKRSPKQ